MEASQLFSTDPARTTQPRHRLSLRLFYFVKLWGVKALGWALLQLVWHLRRPPPPTRSVIYATRPTLEHRVFLPASHKDAGLSAKKLPVYISIHGGGFAAAFPAVDDSFCAYMSQTHEICVVSINYRKAPSYPFPVPAQDIAAVTLAILADTSLPIDTARVAIGGFSAGGNLALSAVQLPELKGKVHAVLPWYAITDFSTSLQTKLSRRRYVKPGEKVKDLLEPMGGMIHWGYIPEGMKLADPLLSPIFAERKALPEWVFVLAAEIDMLAEEGREMAERWAGKELGDNYEAGDGKLRWKLVKTVRHGFTVEQGGASKEDEKKRVEICERVIDEVAQWLFKGPFAT